jgi:3-methylcrotonyl-CoA carboxylase alpha subunit/geranyl-CoA carboxylase alpha subunit
MGLNDEVLSLSLQELGQGQVRLQIQDSTHEAHVQRSGEALHITLNGQHWQTHAVVCTGAVQRWHVQLQGPECVELWLTDQSHSAPSTGASAQAAQSLRAPFNGKLIALHVQEGQQVKQGDAVLVIESMKLEHILCAPRDAVVHSISASVGQQVGPGQVLVQWKDAT